MIRFIHIADLHCNRVRKEKCIEALNKILNYIKTNSTKDSPIYLFIAGDFWDSAINASDSSGYNDFLLIMKEIIAVTKVFMITGTPHHEVTGSLKAFKLLGANVYDKNTFVEFEDFELIALPTPRKAEYLNLKKSKETLEECINRYTQDFIDSVPKKSKSRIVMLHGEIAGVTYPNGIPGKSKIAFTPKQLRSLNADYIACGHIHSDLKVEGVDNCYYVGSICPKDFGETLDSGFYYVEVE